MAGNISNSDSTLLQTCRKALRENDVLTIDRLFPIVLKDASNEVNIMMNSEYHKLVDSPDMVCLYFSYLHGQAMHEISVFLSTCNCSLQLDDMLTLMLQQADIYLVLCFNSKELGNWN